MEEEKIRMRVASKEPCLRDMSATNLRDSSIGKLRRVRGTINDRLRPEMPDATPCPDSRPDSPEMDIPNSSPLLEAPDSSSGGRVPSFTLIDDDEVRLKRSRFRWRSGRVPLSMSVPLIMCMYLVVMMLTVGAETEEDWSTLCPSSCQCKWVSGKRTAECKDADFKMIPSGFSEELQILHLERNSITKLTRDVFKNAGLINLQKIYLNGNKIESVHKEAFRDLQILIELDLSDNRISTIDMESFDTNARLRELHLNNNPITKLSGSQFPRLEQFKLLEMKNCKLSQLSRNSFERLTYLEHLDLSGNRFQHISVEVLQPLEKLKTLNLEGNPWKCDCRLKSFRDWTMSKKLIPSGVTCVEPDNLANLDWIKLLTDNFACKPEIITLQISGTATDALIVGDVGKDITLECLVRANPPAQVRWMRDGLLVNNSTTSIHGKTYVVHISGESERWVNLTILRSHPVDAGEYTCVGENPGGTVDKNLTLNFQDVPSGAGVGVGTLGDHGASSKSLFWILLGIVGSLVVLTMIIMLICLCSRRRRVKTTRSQDIKSTQHQPLVDNHSGEITSDPSSPQRQGPGDGNTPLLTKSYLAPEEATDYPDILDSHRRTQDSPHSSSASTVPDPTRLVMPQQLNPAELYDQAGTPVIGLPYAPLHYHPHLIHHGLGRPHSPYSGSVASFASEPPQAIVPPANRPGYVTLPRRPRVPSWSPGTHTSHYPGTPLAPSPTGSSITTAGYPYVKYDNLGPRTTADGSSKLSLTKVGLGNETPSMPSTPQYYGGTLPHTSRSPAFRPAPLNQPHNSASPFFNFAPIQENDDPTTPTEMPNSVFSPSQKESSAAPLATLPRSWKPKSPTSQPLMPNVNGGHPYHKVSPLRGSATPKKVPPKPPPKPSKKVSSVSVSEEEPVELVESENKVQRVGVGDDGTEV